jgi:hypothetical protein
MNITTFSLDYHHHTPHSHTDADNVSDRCRLRESRAINVMLFYAMVPCVVPSAPCAMEPERRTVAFSKHKKGTKKAKKRLSESESDLLYAHRASRASLRRFA